MDITSFFSSNLYRAPRSLEADYHSLNTDSSLSKYVTFTSYSTILCLSTLICKIGKILALTYNIVMRPADTQEVFSNVIYYYHNNANHCNNFLLGTSIHRAYFLYDLQSLLDHS